MIRLIQAYTAPCVTLPIHNLAILQALPYLETEAYSKPCENLSRYIQIPAIVRTVYSGVIQPYSEPCVMLSYAETWHVWNPVIFRALS